MDFLFRESPVDVEVRAEIDEVMDDLEDTEGRADNLVPAFRVFDSTMNSLMWAQFQSAGRHFGQPWKPVMQSTLENRAQNRGGRAHPLWDTGTLRGSLTKVGGHGYNVFRPHRYVRGTHVGYASFVGDPEGPRPIFPEDDWPRPMERAFTKTLSDYMTRQGVFKGF